MTNHSYKLPIFKEEQIFKSICSYRSVKIPLKGKVVNLIIIWEKLVGISITNVFMLLKPFITLTY